uniref:Uncharacterized protein n=1 Tax=Haptolina brevifila TaxID=156173 RepID=A0A7S2JGK8_9EUKA
MAAPPPPPNNPLCHDIRPGFAFMYAAMSFVVGAQSLADDNLRETLPKLQEADTMMAAAKDDDWVGTRAFRGGTHVMIGVMKLGNGEYVGGAWSVWQAWRKLKSIKEEQLLEYQGIEGVVVRSVSLFMLGALQLFGSLMRPLMPRLFGGEKGKALQMLHQCVEEDGLCATNAAHLLVEWFLGGVQQLRFEPFTARELALCDKLLERCETKYPDSLYASIPRIHHLMRRGETKAALVHSQETFAHPVVASKLSHQMMRAQLQSKCLFVLMQWKEAGDVVQASIDRFIAEQRYSLVPSLAALASWFYWASGDVARGPELKALVASIELAQRARKFHRADKRIWQEGRRQMELIDEAASGGGTPPKQAALLEMITVHLSKGAGVQMSPESTESILELLEAEETTGPCASDSEWVAHSTLCRAEFHMSQAEASVLRDDLPTAGSSGSDEAGGVRGSESDAGSEPWKGFEAGKNEARSRRLKRLEAALELCAKARKLLQPPPSGWGSLGSLFAGGTGRAKSKGLLAHCLFIESCALLYKGSLVGVSSQRAVWIMALDAAKQSAAQGTSKELPGVVLRLRLPLLKNRIQVLLDDHSQQVLPGAAVSI